MPGDAGDQVGQLPGGCRQLLDDDLDGRGHLGVVDRRPHRDELRLRDPERRLDVLAQLGRGPGALPVGRGDQPGPGGLQLAQPSRVEIDGAAVLRAAEAAVRLWSDDPYCSAD